MKYIYGAGAGGAVLLVVIIIIVVCCIKRRRNTGTFTEVGVNEQYVNNAREGSSACQLKKKVFHPTFTKLWVGQQLSDG